MRELQSPQQQKTMEEQLSRKNLNPILMFQLNGSLKLSSLLNKIRKQQKSSYQLTNLLTILHLEHIYFIGFVNWRKITVHNGFYLSLFPVQFIRSKLRVERPRYVCSCVLNYSTICYSQLLLLDQPSLWLDLLCIG